MTGFSYVNGILHAEDVPLDRIAGDAGTPTYVYALTTIGDAFDRFRAAIDDPGALIAYAMKANDCMAVLTTLARRGAGADVVSGGELAKALAAGFPAEKIVFAGVGKTPAEMKQGLEAGIFQFNVESEPELRALDQVSQAMGTRARVALRVNPHVDAKTHSKISTGRKGDKFGIDIDQIEAIVRLAATLPGIDLRGIAAHIGSQLLDVAPYRAAFEKLADLVRSLRAEGFAIDRLDFGGGLGIAYKGDARPDVLEYAGLARSASHNLGVRMVFEPGRWMVGDAGVLLARVVFVKQGSDRRFLILDAAMNDLMRPALYDSYHAILPVKEPAPGAEISPVDVVGPICESTDRFAEARPMPPLASGDLIAFMNAGAYGAVMASTYNARALPVEVAVRGSECAIVRPRKPVTALYEDETLPAWL